MSAQERLGRAFLNGVPEETWAELYPFIHMDADLIAAILAADPHLAQDIEDGAALRRLRAALPEGWDLIVRNFGSRWGVELWDPRYPASHDEPPQPRYLEFAPTIAAAADKAREAIEEAR